MIFVAPFVIFVAPFVIFVANASVTFVGGSSFVAGVAYVLNRLQSIP